MSSKSINPIIPSLCKRLFLFIFLLFLAPVFDLPIKFLLDSCTLVSPFPLKTLNIVFIIFQIECVNHPNITNNLHKNINNPTEILKIIPVNVPIKIKVSKDSH
ncbi:unnamed protein product [Meloidogyne enterolobii]|uniref:Uncharacterized protein n=1 Tax=Meloidogyne enterolobii TaxID=390850 RepID=A0ACB0YDN9_MELEN